MSDRRLFVKGALMLSGALFGLEGCGVRGKGRGFAGGVLSTFGEVVRRGAGGSARSAGGDSERA